MKAFSKKIITGITTLLFAVSAMFSFAIPAYASNGNNKVVKAGFFAYPGYHDFDGNVRSGYGVDFLTLLQRYTNLNYEYVGYENSWEEMQRMLLDGEIDLVTSARKTAEREEMFDFSEPIGESYAQINVRRDDARFTPGDYHTLNGITIGLISGNSRNADLERFADEKGFTYKTVEFNTAEELEQALMARKIDAAASGSLRKTSGEKTIAEFAPENFYVIVRKGDSGLLEEVNYGINQMDINEGNWRDDLRYKNYESENDSFLEFTQREREYIRSVQNGEKTITVSARPDRDPYSFIVNGELTGIIPDYFAHLMEIAGLPYTTLAARDKDEFQNWTMTNYTDIIMDCRYPYSPSEQFEFGLVTEPYMAMTVSLVTQKGFNGEIKTIATADLQETELFAGNVAEGTVYLIVDTSEAAMQAVLDGKADACYVCTYTAEKFINKDSESSLQSNILKSPVFNECIYISPESDHELCSILNKCIKADASGVLDEFVKDYTAAAYQNMTFSQYLKMNPQIVILSAAALALLVIIIAVTVLRSRTAEMKNAQLEHELVEQRRLEDSRKEIAEQKTQLEKSLTFTNYFLNSYLSAYYIGFDDRSCQIYKRTEELENNYPIITDYLDSLGKYIRKDVYEEDREELLELVQPEKMQMMLREQPEFTHSFRDVSEGKEKIYRMRVIRGADEMHAAFGFEDITEETRKQQEQLLAEEERKRAKILEAELVLSKLRADSLDYIEDNEPELDDAINFFGNRILQISGCDQVVYRELDGHRIVLNAAGVSDIPQEICAVCPFAQFDCEAFKEDGTVLMNDCGTGYRGVMAPPDCPAKSSYMQMIHSGGKLVGKLTVHYLKERHSFTENEISMMDIVAVYLGLLIGRINEKKAEIARIEAESSNKAKSEFLFNMSHDMRTPMNAIIGFTDKAIKNKNDQKTVDESLEKVKSSSEYLLNIINDILDMARIESGKLEIHNELHNIFEGNNTLTQMLGTQAAKKGIEFHTFYDIKDKYCWIDANRVGQICANLLSNSIKYTDAGGEIWYSVVQVPSEREGYGRFVATVKDTGRGMSPEFLSRIFDSFEREKSAIRSGEQGTGLGMAIVKRLADAMDGVIDIQSELGKGTTVTFTAEHRLATQEEIESIKAAGEGSAEAVKTDFAGKKVLLVEDNELNREIANDILEEEGLAVENAGDGTEAVEMMREKGPDYYDFILMDIQMPVMNGYEATKAIREMYPDADIPIIALSANAFAEDKAASLAAGMNDHIAKPVNVKELFAVLSEYL